MKLLAVCCVFCLLVCIADAGSQVQGSSVEIRNADIDSSWYTGRGIRPVGRFGRRGLTLENIRKYELGTRRVCIPIQESEDYNPNE
ncbi:prolactin-releasing peptide [Scyliorhinus canicula]|uniref:prolactin-releasing peptide n=1 Tax=Scyliorhinus canicula TaxID=7830 RepID=UPI0018F4699D|nr:prolactin-releasing peptide [Scyliorhinus canicula]